MAWHMAPLPAERAGMPPAANDASRPGCVRRRPAPHARLAALLALGVLAGGPAAAASLPASVLAAPDVQLKEVGRGDLRWLGFEIYEASLYSPDGRFWGLEPGRPVALSLWYRRNFSRAELLKITTGEWARLGLAPAEASRRWTAELERLWTDVRRGDNLTAVVVPGGETRFYDASRLLGRVEDPAFGPAYLAIWLDPRSAVSGLRADLLHARQCDSRTSGVTARPPLQDTQRCPTN
jgi:hypothetical protein